MVGKVEGEGLFRATPPPPFSVHSIAVDGRSLRARPGRPTPRKVLIELSQEVSVHLHDKDMRAKQTHNQFNQFVS